MPNVLRRGALLPLFLLVASSLFAQQTPWELPAFTAEPKALLAAAARVETGDYAKVFLLDEAEYVFDDARGARTRERLMTYVVAEAGIEYASEVRASWMPWVSGRPTIEARVITKDGTVHTLDQAAVVEVPAGEQEDIFSDGRTLRAPLPGVAVGSVVEYVITGSMRSPIQGGGVSINYFFGGFHPAERTRVTLDSPMAIEPRIVNRTGVEPRVEEKDGRRRMVFEAGRIEGNREWEEYVPFDISQSRYVGFSTGTSWQEIATSYGAIVDKQIAGSELQKLVRTAVGKATERKEIVDRLLAAIQKDVRYAGVEVGEGSIVPRPPRTVLANKYGDCKDKATLLVAMLREAGFPAHVALLQAGDDLDVHAELPGVTPFNHAIVVVEGGPAIWVDPTDVFARAGELPLGDQGRQALIAKAETTTLVRTPETEAAASVYREQRTFLLPEDGKPRVVEISEGTATAEAGLRRWVTGLDAKGLREKIESYAKSAYVAKTITGYQVTEANDLTKPFRLTIEVPESASGIVQNGEASVVINIAGLPRQIPDTLRDWKDPQPGDDPDDAPKKRKHDFLFPNPSIVEWAYRIVPPPGYVPGTLPESKTTAIGTTSFTQEVHAEPDNSVLATFRFDSGKRRLTPAEFEATRVPFTKFVDDNRVTIRFGHVGQAKLTAGDVRGALDEYRRLVALHPKEAQHHIETARALLAGGLGEAAREEIRRAVATEPKSARAHQNLGYILLHDSLGRPYRKGFDRAGAIAALRKAKELDPTDRSIRIDLASALTYGEDGRRFGRGALLAEAAEEYKAMAADLGDEGKAMLPELTLVYAYLGRFAEMRELATTIDDETQSRLARILSTAAIDGAEAALRELGAFALEQRRSYASASAEMLMKLRLYPQSAALMEVAVQGTPAAAEQRPFLDTLKKLRRFEELPKDDGPRGAIINFIQAVLRYDLETVKQFVPSEYAETGAMGDMRRLETQLPDDMPVAVFGDLVMAVMDLQQEGDDEAGYRLRLRMRGVPGGGEDTSLYVRRQDGRWVFGGAKNVETITGASVLAMAAKGQLEAARRWLNWARDDVKGGSGDDPLDGAPFASLWPKSKAAATADEIRIAAASLATDKVGWGRSEPILTAARDGAAGEQARAAIDLALVQIYEGQHEWAKMLATTSRLAPSHPDSATAFSRHVEALLRNGKAAEATALAKARLEKLPNDRDAMHALARSAAESEDYAAALEYANKVVDDLRPNLEDFADAAWLALFTGKELERAIEHAQHASQHDPKEATVRSLQTLAALYAEAGKSVEARAALLQGIDKDSRSELEDRDWYILGRIAENYGVDDFAIAAYRKVDGTTKGASATTLAQRRLHGLTGKKKD
jgi:tetratricopeptide (TPR) repeat protein